MPQVSIREVFIPNVTADKTFQELMPLLARQKGVRLERPAPDTLVVHHRHCPGWAVALGIIGLLVFLLGLLFFLVRTTETATVVGRDVEGGATFTATGFTSIEVSNFLHGRLAARELRPCPSCRAMMGWRQSVCWKCGKSSVPYIDHAGVMWCHSPGGWQWYDADTSVWRWYKDGTSTGSSHLKGAARRRAIEPSTKIDPAVVSPPSIPEPASPAPAVAPTPERPSESPAADSPALAGELERLADLHARGVLTDEEFQQAKQRVLSGGGS